MGDWYGRAKRVTAGAGQSMGPGGTRKLVVHAEGVNRADPDPVALANYQLQHGGAYHFIVALHGKNAGQVVQLLPASRGAYSMGGYADKLGWSLNRYGSRCIQVSVAGVTSAPDWSKLSPKARLAWLRLLRWIKREHGVPMVTPKGVRWDHAQHVSKRKWAKRSGVFNHGSAPYNTHTDGPGHGIPLGIVRKGQEQKPLTRMIRRNKKNAR